MNGNEHETISSEYETTTVKPNDFSIMSFVHSSKRSTLQWFYYLELNNYV